jgi:hypothetical protein
MINLILFLIIFIISILSLSFIITQPILFLILIPLIGVLLILFLDLNIINHNKENTLSTTNLKELPQILLFFINLLKKINGTIIPHTQEQTSLNLQAVNDKYLNINSLFFIIALFFSLLNLIISMIM